MSTKRRGVRDVDVQRLAPGLRVRAHDGMLGDEVLARPRPTRWSRMRSSRVFETSASAELFTASQAVEHLAASPGESASYAAYMLANIVSPPYGGTSRASSIVRHRRALEVHGVAVPDAAEVHRLVRQLRHRDDLRVAVDALHERVLAPARRCGAANARNASGIEVLVAEEDDEVLEPDATDLGDGGVVEVARGRRR